MNPKKVSIVIPGYKPDFFLQTLKSALGQTYGNTEIIVSDNCPGEEIKSICSLYPMVKYRRNTRIGYLNILDSIYECDGDYIKPLFDDDLLHPFCVERMVKSSDRNDFSFVFSASQVIDIENYITENRTPFNKHMTISHEELTRAMLLNFRNFVGEFSSIMISKAALQSISPASLFVYGNYECIKGLSDVAAFINLSKIKKVHYVNEILSYFRRDKRLNSNSNQDPVANPNFKFAITDWIDLLMQAHINGYVSDEELIGRQEFVVQFVKIFENNYPDVRNHSLLFSKYLSQLNFK